MRNPIAITVVAPLREFSRTCGRGELEMVIWQVAKAIHDDAGTFAQELFERAPVGNPVVEEWMNDILDGLEDIISTIQNDREGRG
jgi:predicted NBD/HSP70 family sugar kinase